METVKDGVITVGTIFFALALGSTAILGRWFCGWGCHVVMLQDFCGHLMKRAGIRPRLFRSRLLLWMPLALAVYMFLWPVIYRLAIAPYTRPDLEWPGFT
ncbi:MAG: 4Fe-4S binding protein, partial [bacterium]